MRVMLLSVVSLLLCFSTVLLAEPELEGKPVQYKQGDKVLEGYMVYDKNMEGTRPGIIVVHEWWGHNEYARQRADQLAKLGYVAFAIDMYGKGVLVDNAKEASELAGQFYQDRNLMRTRAAAGMEILKNHKLVDKEKIAAIGFCFGGTVALELARSGADLAGVVSFHGGLNTPNPEDAKNIKGQVLVLHGGNDPFVKMEEVNKFMDEMRNAGVNWQVNIYGGAMHSFSNPEADKHNLDGASYNEQAAKRSWKAMKIFFKDLFGTKNK